MLVEGTPLCKWRREYPELDMDLDTVILYPFGYPLACGLWKGDDLAMYVRDLVSAVIGSKYTVTLKAGPCPAESEE